MVQDLGLRFRVWGAGYVFGYGIWGSGFRVKGQVLKFQGLGFGV